MLRPDDPLLAAEDEATLDLVLELPDVARPGIGVEEFEGLGGEDEPSSAKLPAVLLGEMVEEGLHILPPFAQGRNLDRHDPEPVVQVFPEAALADFPLEHLVGRADEPDVDPAHPVLSDPPNLFVLKNAEELGLEGRAEVSDLVEKEGPPGSLLDQAGLVANGSGERPPGVAEELALEKMVGDGPPVDGHEGGQFARPPEVDRPGDELLSRPALPGDEDGRSEVLDPVDELGDPADGRASPDEQAVARKISHLLRPVKHSGPT